MCEYSSAEKGNLKKHMKQHEKSYDNNELTESNDINNEIDKSLN